MINPTLTAMYFVQAIHIDEDCRRAFYGRIRLDGRCESQVLQELSECARAFCDRFNAKATANMHVKKGLPYCTIVSEYGKELAYHFAARGAFLGLTQQRSPIYKLLDKWFTEPTKETKGFDYIVLYNDAPSKVSAPLGFACCADNTFHAEEQCLNAYPECEIVWVYFGNDIRAALSDYWTWEKGGNTDETI